ncbi:MAG TPA: UDP-galactose-lipid carrier transferase [Solirubrobacteraceae bacterium]|nr:UDP-galactose-lipid carrier transferase [Solirubrobacteraceae bacterium]
MGRLDEVDLSRSLSREESEKRLRVLQERLLALRLELAGLCDDGHLGPPVCVLFEGWDASGKGGAIKRLVAPLDPRHVRVAEFAAPDATAKRHHFLWRFWPALPGWGGFTVLDRSWYGRVLVERVDELAAEEEWKRAYGEIVEFERMLTEEGTVLIKLFLHISSDEQLKRFEARANDPLKSWKLSPDDWRNRSEREPYTQALEEMFERTDAKHARWHVVAAESKHYARAHVLETVIAEIERGCGRLGMRLPES